MSTPTQTNVTIRYRPAPNQEAEASLSSLIDQAMCADVGAILVRDTDRWKCLDPGTSGYVLTTQGSNGPPFWSPAGTAYLAPAFTAFGITGVSSPVEVGTTLAAGDYTFTWTTSNSANVQANSIAIKDTTGGTTLASGLANTGSHVITLAGITNNAPASQVWTIQGTNTQSATFSKTYTLSWLWRVYAGDSANATLTANQIKALSASAALQAGFAGTYSITQSTDYGYFSYPDSLGDVSNFIDGNTNVPISMATASDNAAYSNTANGWSYALVSVTNAQGVATNYRVYRTQYTFSGTLKIVVS